MNSTEQKSPKDLVQQFVHHQISSEASEEMLASIHAHPPRAQVAWAKVALVALALCVLGGGLIWFWSAQAPPASMPSNDTPATMVASRSVVLLDGSTMTPDTDDTQLVLERATPQEVRVQLRQGQARFDVKKHATRRFVVVADDVEVVVRGTSFDVQRQRQGELFVVVHEGHVSVNTPQGSTELYEGQTWSMKTPQINEPKSPPLIKPQPPKPPVPRDKWQQLARDGKYQEASKLLGAGERPESYQETILAVETMRMVKKPAQAAAYLATFIQRHPKDTRATYAKFTQGRIVMRDLRKPKEAAKIFGQLKYQLSPSSPLYEDALAREVEAYARSGQNKRAHSLAKAYVRQFPQGTRLESVKRWGNLK